MQRQIIVTISPEGEVEVKVEGHAGSGCKDLTRTLEVALGTTTAHRKTPEYHQAERQDRQQATGG